MYSIFLCVIYLILFTYVLTMIVLIHGLLDALSKAKLGKVANTAYTANAEHITVLIPFRNEASSLPALLDQLAHVRVQWPDLKIIIVDDHSEDNSLAACATAVSDNDIIALSNDGEGKLQAIQTGLKHVETARVIFLDADITLGPRWGDAMQRALMISPHSDLIICPVLPTDSQNWIQSLAALDFYALIGVTMASAAVRHPVMANGAQLVASVSKISWPPGVVSGDDVFALHQMKHSSSPISYSMDPDLAVETPMPDDLQSFWMQRRRWASKATRYSDRDTLALGWIQVLINATVWVLLVGVLLEVLSLWILLGMLLTKFVTDLIFMSVLFRVLPSKAELKYFPLVFLSSILMYPCLFIMSLTSGFEWKGRTYSSQ